MNTATLRALFRDALYQVLDNLGFRILGCLFLLPVALTFMVGIRDDGIWLLHTWNWTWADFASGFNMPVPTDADLNGLSEQVLSGVVTVMLDYVADKFGFVFGVAAISFFVPQMLEKGAADVVFSKPVSRTALFLSRYFGGLLFVGFLSTLLVGGMFLGFWVTSGYRDTGLVWSVATLVYGFAIFHAISCTLGVFTRSAIGALLLTVVFMPINCGVHKVWEKVAVSQQLRHAAQANAEPSKDEDWSWMHAASAGLDLYHVTMPKSRDATRVAGSLREHFDATTPEFADTDLGLTVSAIPQGFTREPRSAFGGEGVLWIAPHPTNGAEASWRFKKEATAGVSPSAAVKNFKKEREADSNASELVQSRTELAGRTADRFEWNEKRGAETRSRRRWMMSTGSSMLVLEYDAELEWARAEQQLKNADAFLAAIHMRDPMEMQMEREDYDHYFTWGGPWRFNAWFSILTTLAFVVVTLGVGIWRLKRIDF